MQRYGITDEPLVKESLTSGADIVSFSGDKLLGGPQCGIVVGSKTYVDAMKNNPLYRALRADKMTIAALEATLRVYADFNTAERGIPILAMLSLTDEALRSRAEKLYSDIQQRGGEAEVVTAKSVAGGGAVPGLELKSYAVAPISKESADELQKQLRNQQIPIIGHIENNQLLLDVRTLFLEDYEYIANKIIEIQKNST